MNCFDVAIEHAAQHLPFCSKSREREWGGSRKSGESDSIHLVAVYALGGESVAWGAYLFASCSSGRTGLVEWDSCLSCASCFLSSLSRHIRPGTWTEPMDQCLIVSSDSGSSVSGQVSLTHVSGDTTTGFSRGHGVQRV